MYENAASDFVRGDFAGEKVNMEAGVSNYYMFTSYAKDTSNVYRFTGDIAQRGCAACSPRFALKLADRIVAGPVFNPDSSISTGMRPYYYRTAGYEVRFVSLFNKTIKSIQWDFGDGATSTQASPTHVFTGPGPYSICVTAANGGGCSSSICNTMRFDDPHLRTSVVVTQMNGKSAQFDNQTSGTAPFTYFWDFGDGQFSTAASPLHSYSVIGSYGVRLRVTDAKGEVAVSYYNVVTGGDLSSCAINYGTGGIREIVNRGLGEVDFSWTNSQGRVFTTANVIQPADSYFEITEVVNAGTNEKGEPIVKVRARFNCMMTDGVSTVRSKGDMAIALAHP